MSRQILHVDMDEFYAAVEKLDRPELRGRCLLVGGDPTARGVVSTASYEARAYGCHSAMPMAVAVRLCPRAVVLPVRGRRYRQVSERVFEVLGRYTPLVEPVSVDEAFLDVTGCERLFGSGEEIARAIRRAIRQDLALTASVGVAPNKFLAKLASDLHKPDGLTVITAENLRAVLDPLPVSKLWGVGPAAETRLHRLNIHTVGQLLRTGLETLTDALGEAGEQLHRLAEGRDDRPVVPDSRAKSISQEQTFPVDVDDAQHLRDVLLEQVEQVSRRLRRHGLRARTVTLKLRTGDFTTHTRSAKLPEPTHLTEEIRQRADELLRTWTRRRPRPLRLLGAAASDLVPARGGQLSLFEDAGRDKLQRLDHTLDEIARRFGDGAVRRGRTRRSEGGQPPR